MSEKQNVMNKDSNWLKPLKFYLYFSCIAAWCWFLLVWKPIAVNEVAVLFKNGIFTSFVMGMWNILIYTICIIIATLVLAELKQGEFLSRKNLNRIRRIVTLVALTFMFNVGHFFLLWALFHQISFNTFIETLLDGSLSLLLVLGCLLVARMAAAGYLIKQEQALTI